MAAPSRSSLRAARALGQHAVGRRLGARLSFAAAVAIALVFGFAASSGVDLAAEHNQGLVATCLGWSAWLAGGPYALATAHDENDRGLAALGRLAGIDDSTQALGRIVAAANQIALRVALPALFVCLAGVVRVPSVGWGSLAIGASASAIVVGVVLAAVAGLSLRLAPERARTLFLAVVLLPFAAAQSSSIEGASVPGALGAVIDLFTGRRIA